MELVTRFLSSSKGADFAVAANYGGNDEAAHKFQAETGIPIYKWDVGSYEACAAGLKQVEFQVGSISVIVNNAGITRDAMLHRMTPEQWREVIRVDLDSMFNMVHPVINGMRDRHFGRIVNISSINGQKGQMGQSNYSAAKAGVIGFTKALALENAKKGITVNCIAPGYVDTEMVHAVPEKVLRGDHCENPRGAPWQSRRDSQMRCLPCRRRRRLYDGRDAVGERLPILRIARAELAASARARQRVPRIPAAGRARYGFFDGSSIVSPSTANLPNPR